MIDFDNPGWTPSKVFPITRPDEKCVACGHVIAIGEQACYRRWQRRGPGQLVCVGHVHFGPDGPVPPPAPRDRKRTVNTAELRWYGSKVFRHNPGNRESSCKACNRRIESGEPCQFARWRKRGPGVLVHAAHLEDLQPVIESTLEGTRT